jgi:Zn-dependent protease
MSVLPPHEDAARKRLENLRAVMAGPAVKTTAAAPAPGPAGAPDAPHGHHRARNGVLGTLAAGGLFLLGKLKFLGVLASVLKFNTLATMVLSVALYASGWGWPFAVGFVLLIFVHELGHAIVLKHEGIPAGAPVFIPFMGAFIAMKGRPRDAYIEAKVAIGGPVLGSLAAWAVLAAGLTLGRPFLVTLGHTGILLNLFNLIPVSPLDGGRIAGVFTRGFWIAGYALGVVALVVTRSPILLLVLLVGLYTLWQRWRHPVPGYDQVPGGKRLAMGLAFAVLVLALALTLPLGMQTHPELGG